MNTQDSIERECRAIVQEYRDVIGTDEDASIHVSRMIAMGMTTEVRKVLDHLRDLRRLFPKAIRRRMVTDYLLTTLKQRERGTLKEWTDSLGAKGWVR